MQWPDNDHALYGYPVQSPGIHSYILCLRIIESDLKYVSKCADKSGTSDFLLKGMPLVFKRSATDNARRGFLVKCR